MRELHEALEGEATSLRSELLRRKAQTAQSILRHWRYRAVMPAFQAWRRWARERRQRKQVLLTKVLNRMAAGKAWK